MHVPLALELKKFLVRYTSSGPMKRRPMMETNACIFACEKFNRLLVDISDKEE